MNLITGRAGAAHITPRQDAMWHQGLIEMESCIFDAYENFAAEIITNNEVRIRSGVGMLQGRFFCIEPNTYDSAEIANGNQGEERIDLIVARITVDASANTQSASIEVIQGAPAAENPTTPEAITGDLDAGDLIADYPLAVVRISGINITSVENTFNAGWLSLPQTRQNINFIGSNPISSEADDAPENWATLKTGHAVFTENRLKNQPAQYGFVENIVAGNSISQRFTSTNAGIWYRTGNVNGGWNNKWHDFELMDYYVNTDDTFETTLNEILSNMINTTVRQFQFHDPQGLYDNKFIGTLWRYTSSYAALEAFSYSGYSARKCLYNGEWGPWEWVNPPMAFGVEYRTIKRINNKPVYEMYISLGKLPNNSDMTFTVGASGEEIDKVLTLEAFAQNTDNYYMSHFPYINASFECIGSVRRTGIRTFYIDTNGNLSTYNGYVHIEYTKA